MYIKVHGTLNNTCSPQQNPFPSTELVPNQPQKRQTQKCNTTQLKTPTKHNKTQPENTKTYNQKNTTKHIYHMVSS